MEFRIRNAAAVDAESLLRVLLASFAEYAGRLDPPSGIHAETVESTRRRIEQGAALFAEQEGACIGGAFLEPREGFLYLGRLGVLPAHRQRGVGQSLLEAAESWARERDYRSIRLGVRVRLPHLHRYYESKGYRIIAFHSHPGYSDPTYVEMEKELGPPP